MQSVRTILAVVVANTVIGCSVYLEHVGWLDGPEQKIMYSSSTRADFEKISGDSIYVESLTNDRILRIYEYFDGEKCVNTSYHECDIMSRDRWGGTILSVMTAGVFEPIAYMRATGEREEGKVRVFVIYESNDDIVAVCPSTIMMPAYHLQQHSLCDSLEWAESIESISNHQD